MVHKDQAGGLRAMDVDHFDPRKKRDYLQSYENLYLACRHCNGKKSDQWPSKEERSRGIRFLDCCAEKDYGIHIFEDPVTHKVFGVTPAGKYHVRILDLNDEFLVQQRQFRAQLLFFLRHAMATMKGGSFEALALTIAVLTNHLKTLIPEIPYRKGPDAGKRE